MIHIIGFPSFFFLSIFSFYSFLSIAECIHLIIHFFCNVHYYEHISFLYITCKFKGPKNWSHVTPCWFRCAGKRQSPINIRRADATYSILVPFNSTYLTGKNSKSQAVTTVIQTIHIDN